MLKEYSFSSVPQKMDHGSVRQVPITPLKCANWMLSKRFPNICLLGSVWLLINKKLSEILFKDPHEEKSMLTYVTRLTDYLHKETLRLHKKILAKISIKI